jgi:adenine-specific DNA-methyltransferase
MDKRELQELLSQSYKQENWRKIVSFVFPNVSLREKPANLKVEEKFQDIVESFKQLGYVILQDGKKLALLELRVKENVNLVKNRVRLNEVVSSVINFESAYGVLSIFEKGTEDYRFTFSAKSNEFDEEEGDFVQKKTDTKRYTYVLGKNESCKTPAERFFKLSEKKSEVDINAIQNAFSVEQLSKEFFEKYKKQFEKFWKYIHTNEEYNNILFGTDREKGIRDFTKKLLGRIVFLHFLQKKGWMGCTAGIKEWKDGDKQFMQTLFESYSDQSSFHSKCLAELFYNTLNKRRTDDLFVCDELEGVLSKSKVPYLNGGLFDSDEDITRKIDFPASYFQELFDFFGQYNFTIDENDPNDHEVGIDPEMLGHIFENLLEDNKDKGAFYTPKVIVQYMCQESIIEYINTKINEVENPEIKSAVEDLIRNKLAEKCSDLDLVQPISKALFEVKICDPAIGSGAFPMGILNVIYSAIEELYFIQPDSVATIWKISDTEWQPHLVKKNIIQHSIYGVDLESGAVDIARLRFWLALVVDEIEPLPLPNLDYKIMQGNSLLESFEGIDLSQISDASAYEEVYETEQIDMFSGEAKKSVSISLSFDDIESLMDDYFNANDPDTKKDIHKKIDDQVLNHIRFTLLQHKQNLLTKKTPLERKLKLDEASASTWQQKEKIRTSSKQAKELVKINTDLELFNEKEIKLAQLSNSNERPFFLWHLFFKEVFDEGGFDIIIGNPPYVLISKEEFDKQYKQYYHLQEGKIDLYRLFTEFSLKLIKHGGTFSFIIPNTILTIPSCKILRNYLLENTQIKKILNFEIDIFKSASVNSIIMISSVGKAKNNFISVNANESISNIFKYRFEKMCQNRFLENDKHEINIYISEKDYFLLNKIYQKSSNLNQLGYEISLGTQVYHNTLHSEDQIKDRFLHSPFPKNDLYELELGGRKINQFTVKMEGDYVDFSREFYTKPNDKFFFGQKVILREITGKTLIATYSEERFVVNKSCYSIYHKDKIMLKALTGLLNSQLIGFVISKLGDKSNQKLFPRITMNMINNIPVYFGGKESEIASIVDNLSLNGNSNNFDKLLSLDNIIYNLFELDSDEIKSIGENQYCSEQ